MKVDVLAIGAHPDDVELGVGGTLAQLARDGYAVAILDLSQGEMSSRGTPASRAEEAREAARLLGVRYRENAKLPDGGLANTQEMRVVVAEWIRRFQPTVLLAHMSPDRHPDHRAAHDLTRDAHFVAGLHQIVSDAPPYRPERVYYYHPYFEADFMPSFVMDISKTFDDKCTALRAYASQFHNPEYEGPATPIASEAFWERIETRARYWGGRAGFLLGEPLYSPELLGLNRLPGLHSPTDNPASYGALGA